jgi:two-component system, sensor histidine kinase RegB
MLNIAQKNENDEHAHNVAMRKHFRLLLILRILSINLYAIICCIAYFVFDIMMPIRTIMQELSFFALIGALSFFQYAKRDIFTQAEVFIWLCLDIFILLIVLLQSGGPSNPFLAVFLIPLVLGALIFDRKFAWATFGVIIGAFLLFLIIQSPYWDNGIRHNSFFQMHTWGMIIAYILVASLLVFFVNGVSRTLHERDEENRKLLQQRYEQQELTKMGLLTAAAAHELGTPLSVVSVILNDWRDLSPPRKVADRNQEIETMLAQIEKCKNKLGEILNLNGTTRGFGAKAYNFGVYFNEIINQWQIHTKYKVQIVRDIADINLKFAVDETLKQALFNILDNGARASFENNDNRVLINVLVENNNIIIKIEDFGKGFVNTDFLQKSNSGEAGFGVGLIISKNIMQNLGGFIEIKNKPNQKGAIIFLGFPLHEIA